MPLKTERARPGHYPPYFPGHYWVKQLENVVKVKDPTAAGPVACRLRSTQKRSKAIKRKPRPTHKQRDQQAAGGAAVARRRTKQAAATSRPMTPAAQPPSRAPSHFQFDLLSKRLMPMAQRLLVVRLQPLCTTCGQYILMGAQAWKCVGRCCIRESKREAVPAFAPTNILQQSGRAQPVVPAQALLEAPAAHFCQQCVQGAFRARQIGAARLATSVGHGPVQPCSASHNEGLVGLCKPQVPPSQQLSCIVVDTRPAFLAFCTGNHFQFDTLRRAKFSSSMLIYLLSREDPILCRRVFVHYCNFCRLPTISGHRWCCKLCPDFDACIDCKALCESQGRSVHQHQLHSVRVHDPVFQLRVEVPHSKMQQSSQMQLVLPSS